MLNYFEFCDSYNDLKQFRKFIVSEEIVEDFILKLSLKKRF